MITELILRNQQSFIWDSPVFRSSIHVVKPAITNMYIRYTGYAYMICVPLIIDNTYRKNRVHMINPENTIWKFLNAYNNAKLIQYSKENI